MLFAAASGRGLAEVASLRGVCSAFGWVKRRDIVLASGGVSGGFGAAEAGVWGFVGTKLRTWKWFILLGL